MILESTPRSLNPDFFKLAKIIGTIIISFASAPNFQLPESEYNTGMVVTHSFNREIRFVIMTVKSKPQEFDP